MTRTKAQVNALRILYNALPCGGSISFRTFTESLYPGRGFTNGLQMPAMKILKNLEKFKLIELAQWTHTIRFTSKGIAIAKYYLDDGTTPMQNPQVPQ